jgi:hypothetical protein
VPQEQGVPPEAGAGAVTSLAGVGGLAGSALAIAAIDGLARIQAGHRAPLAARYAAVAMAVIAAAYQVIFKAENVYVFRRTTNGPRLS